MTRTGGITGSIAMATRRSFVVLAVAGAALSLGGSIGVLRPPEDVLDRKLASLYRHADAAKAIGQHVNKTVPTERDVLRARLLTDLGLEPQSIMSLDLEVLRRRLAAKISNDFAREKTVAVEGWVLSETEARLCALAAMCRS